MNDRFTHANRIQFFRERGRRQRGKRVRAGWAPALILALLVPALATTVSGCDLMFDDTASLVASSGGEQAATSTGLGLASLVELVWSPLDLPSRIGGITTSSARQWWSTRSGAERGLILEGLARVVAVGAAVVSDAFDVERSPDPDALADRASRTGQDRDDNASPADQPAGDERAPQMPASTSGDETPSHCESSDPI